MVSTEGSGDAASLRLEYETIHRMRTSLTDSLMRWRQIAIPLCAVVLCVFILVDEKLWGIGWLAGLFVLVYWRMLEKNVNRRIVRSYPRIVELEKALGMTFYSRYIFENRNRDLEAARNPLDESEDGGFNYDGLLALARSKPDDFVRFRGRNPDRWAVWTYGGGGAVIAVGYYVWLLSEWAGGFT